jgi:hypothetical protein
MTAGGVTAGNPIQSRPDTPGLDLDILDFLARTARLGLREALCLDRPLQRAGLEEMDEFEIEDLRDSGEAP